MPIPAHRRRTAGYPTGWNRSSVREWLWLDAADESQFTLGTSAGVAAWYDKSFNKFRFYQATSANRPTRTSGVQNGLPGVTFAGSHWLQGTGFDFSLSPFTAFIVAKKNTSFSSYEGMIEIATPRGLGLGTQASVYQIFAANQLPVAFSPARSVPSTADVLCYQSAGVISNAITVSLRKNGESTTATASYTTVGSSTTLSIGAYLNGSNDKYYGNLCEILIYKEIVSDSFRQYQENRLRTKWGTP